MPLLSGQQDPSNLQGKVQKHQAFEAELSANQSRIDALQKSGQELLDGKHYASTEVAGRMEEVSSQWKKLLEATELKGTRKSLCVMQRLRCDSFSPIILHLTLL